MNKTWIIIASFNAIPWIAKCLDSCGGNKVIVVDNQSTDGTIEFIKTEFPRVKLLLQTKNLGFGAANNIGISYALKNGADNVFLLNQDAYLHKGCIEKLLEAQKKQPEFGILSPIHLNGKGNKLDENFSTYMSYTCNPDFYSDYILQNERKEIYEVPFVNAAGWLLSKKCLETVGGFDPIFFHYGEDDNYCQRVTYHGFKIGVVPAAFINHDRENRKNLHRNDSLNAMARSLKITFSNINRENFFQLENTLKKRKRSKFKSYIKLNLKVANFYEMEIKMLQRLIPEVKKSRKLNKRKGANYLNL